MTMAAEWPPFWKPVPPGHAIVARAGKPVVLEPFLAEHQLAAE